MLEISDTLQSNIIDYYLFPHTCANTAKQFNISVYFVNKILKETNTKQHSKELVQKLTSENTKKALQEKYGVDSPFALKDIQEKSKQTNLKKYGFENPAKNKDIKEKTKQTNLKKYGVKFLMQSKDIQEKSKSTRIEIYGNYINEDKTMQTNLERYGCEWAISAAEVKTKIRETTLKNWGADYYSQSEDWQLNKEKIQIKTKETCNNKYSTDHQMQNPDIAAKVENTLLKKYGVSTFSKTDKFKETMHENKEARIAKLKQTNQALYNVDYYPQTVQYHQIAKKIYVYNNEHFDSLPELAFYLYHLAAKTKIVRNTEKFEYSFKNITHYYFPDFQVNDKFVEIKGPQFIKEDGSWQNPFDHAQDALYEAKHQCALSNKVEILYINDYQKYLDWFFDNGYSEANFIAK